MCREIQVFVHYRETLIRSRISVIIGGGFTTADSENQYQLQLTEKTDLCGAQILFKRQLKYRYSIVIVLETAH